MQFAYAGDEPTTTPARANPNTNVVSSSFIRTNRSLTEPEPPVDVVEGGEKIRLELIGTLLVRKDQLLWWRTKRERAVREGGVREAERRGRGAAAVEERHQQLRMVAVPQQQRQGRD